MQLTRPDAVPAEDLVGYGIATAKGFADLRGVVTRLASVLLLRTLHRRSAILCYDMLHAADVLYAEAADGIASTHPPPRARHHHLHLCKATAAIGAALAACKAADPLGHRLDAALIPLAEGWKQLRFAAASVPGVEVVSVSQACCSEHAQVIAPSGSSRTPPGSM